MKREWALKFTNTDRGVEMIDSHTEDESLVKIWRERKNSLVTIVSREVGEWEEET